MDQVNRMSIRAARNQFQDSTKTSLRRPKRMLPFSAGHLVAVALTLVLILGNLAEQTQANPLLSVSSQERAKRNDNNNNNNVLANHDQQQQSATKQKPAFNNLENIISELLDDVGNRLKKNKLHSIKQTLRFGRSDPYMAPSSSGDDYETLYDRQRELMFEDQDRN